LTWFRRGRRNPWWDTDSRSIGRRRRLPRLIELVVLTVSLMVLGVAYGAIPVRAASVTVNLDQWASTAVAWQNGNLNANNTAYPEGGVVPFRLAIEGLAPGTHTIHINYDFSASGHKAYDFLATWNVTNAAGAICSPSGGAISSMCPSLPTARSMNFPTDAYVADGLRVTGAENYSAAPRRLTIWGGTLLSISSPTHSGSVSGNSSADFVVTFNATGSAVLLAWGGHLAQSAYWDTARGGPRDGASLVSGSPWHMRTLQLDGSGNKNQDRSISPSAIVGELPPFALAPPTAAPPPAPGGGGSAPGPVTPGGPSVTPPPTTTAPEGPDRELDLVATLLLGAWLLALVIAFVRARSTISAR
jgi:hypothetical protein